MPDRIPSALRLANYALFAAASLYLVVFLVIALSRLTYPFDLEWMEGGAVAHVQRILDNQPLYVQPSIDFTPFIYTPLYFQVGALAAKVVGNGFFPLRLVSLLASLGAFALIFLIVRRRTANLAVPFLAVGLFAATFRISGAWFDLARVDSLFLVLLLAGIYAFDSSSASARSFVAPVLLVLSFYAKQSALVVGLGLAAAALLTLQGRERWLFPASFGLLLAGSLAVADWSTGGWFGFYVFELPARHEVLRAMLVRFWTDDILGPLAIATTACLVPLVGASGSNRSRLVRDVLILGSLLVVSFLSRIHEGGYDNVLIPAFAGIAIYAGIGAGSLIEATKGKDRIRLVAVLAAALQFLILAYSPGDQVPTAEDRVRGRQLQELIAAFGGEVYIAGHPWYAGALGKPVHAHEVALRDIVRATGPSTWNDVLEREMAAAIGARRFDAVVTDFLDFPFRPPDFDTHYELVDGDLSRGALRMVTGWDRRPTYLFVRRESGLPAGR